jgi:hypothetical protein
MIAGIALAHHATLAIRNAVNIDVSITTLTPLGSCRERSREPGGGVGMEREFVVGPRAAALSTSPVRRQAIQAYGHPRLHATDPNWRDRTINNGRLPSLIAG